MSFNPLHWFKSKRITRIASFNSGAVFRYKFGYKRNGVDYFPNDFVNNLILDSGLNKVANVLWNNCWAVCLLGDAVSPTPVRRDSNATTFTVVGTACTASGSFFVSADVGRLIKFNDGSGQEFYITAFTSGTLVTLGGTPSPGIVAQTGTIWYVNETGLDSPNSAINTYQTNSGDCQSTVSGNIATYKRTFIGGAIGVTTTFTEIGFNDSTGNTNIFDRDIITGGITLSPGDQPIVIAELLMTFTPNVSTVAGNVGTGLDTSGDVILCGLNVGNSSIIPAIANVSAAGGLSGTPCLEPSTAQNSACYATLYDTFALPAFSNGLGPNLGTNVNPDGVGIGSYSAGNFFRDASCSYSIGLANGTITAICFGAPNIACMVQKFTTPFVKLSTQVLGFTIRKTWQRILVN